MSSEMDHGNNVLSEEEIVPTNSTISSESMDNLIDLPELNEDQIFLSLKQRYEKNIIYTFTGPILIAINPHNEIVPDNSCDLMLEKYCTDLKKLAALGSNSAVNLSNDLDNLLSLDGSGTSESTGRNSSSIRNHSILISGESGSGKTECAKLLLKYLSNKSSTVPATTERPRALSHAASVGTPTSAKLLSPNALVTKPTKGKSIEFVLKQQTIVSNIIQSNVILESFGNAKTLSAFNSSRFGKYLELFLNDESVLVGGVIRSYLLENVRVTSQQLGERNFHIFYQLVNGATEEEKIKWNLTNSTVDSHKLINQGKFGGHNTNKNRNKSNNTAENSKNIEITNNDANKYRELKEHFAALNCDSVEIHKCFDIIAGLLHLGDVDFNSVTDLSGEGSEIKDGAEGTQPLQYAAQLFGVNIDELVHTITIRIMNTRGEVLTKRLTPLQAINARDALAKAIYKKVFDFIVFELNTKIALNAQNKVQITGNNTNNSNSIASPHTTPEKNSSEITIPSNTNKVQQDEISNRIAILDLFGFDAFKVNNFEQLSINYANEVLQQQFNQQIFKFELLEYTKEAIKIDEIVDFADNQDTLDLIQTLLFKTLDDQCKLPGPTDKKFASQLYSVCAKHKKFSADAAKQRDNLFCIHHFAGNVVYSVLNFCDKNTDELPTSAINLLGSSINSVLSRVIYTTFVDNEGVNHNTSMRDMSVTGGLPHSGSGNNINTLNSNNNSNSVNSSVNNRYSTGHNSILQQYNNQYNHNTAVLATPATPSRRLSTSRNAPSAVTQFKHELNVLMKQINSTIPHYIRCINPLSRDADGYKEVNVHGNQGHELQFDQQRVNEQLRSAGVLEAVRVARTGFPIRYFHLEFYLRYRYVNSTSIVLTKAQRSDKVLLKTLCEELLDTIKCNLRERSNSIGNNNGNNSAFNSSISGKFNGSDVNKATSTESVGNSNNTAGGNGIQIGTTRVFLKKLDHKLLESLLETTHTNAINLINSLIYSYAVRIRYLTVLGHIQLINRVMRGGYGRLKARQQLENIQNAIENEHSLKLRQQQLILAQQKALEAARLAEEERVQQLERASLAQIEEKHREYLTRAINLTVNVEFVTAKLAEYKQLDSTLLNEINALINKKKVTDEDSILKFDIQRAKKLLAEWIAQLPHDGILHVTVAEVIRSLDYGYNMLLSEKLIPLTVFGKAFSLGRHVNSNDRTSSVKYASKSITKEHKMFKNIFKLLEKIKECLEISKADKEAYTHKKSVVANGGTVMQNNRIGVATLRGSDTTSHMVNDTAKLDHLLTFTTKIGDFSKILYTYYYQYIVHTVLEFGDNSTYKNNFKDENEYILSLATLIDLKQPLLECERVIDKNTTIINNSGVSNIDDEANTFFPITNTANKLSKTGYNLIDKIFFKSIPYAPGIEFTVNSLNILLNGELLMYPIRFIKLVGKSAGNYNQIAYYQASTKICEATLHTVLREPQYVQKLDTDSFSATLLTMLLLGATNIQPDNFMLKVDRENIFDDDNSSGSNAATNNSPVQQTVFTKLNSSSTDSAEPPLSPAARDRTSSNVSNNSSAKNNSSNNSSKPTASRTREIVNISMQGINNDELFVEGLFNYAQILNINNTANTNSMSHTNKNRLNIMYFLPQMQLPVSDKMRSLLTGTNIAVEELLSNWIRELFLQNRRYEYLKQSGFSNDDLNTLKLPIKLPLNAIAEIYKKLRLIRSYLKNNQNVLNVHMLTVIHPTLAHYYEQLRTKNSGALSQYKSNPIVSTSTLKMDVNAETKNETIALIKQRTETNHTLQTNYTVTIEDTAQQFLQNIDFSQFTENNDILLCKVLSDNLSFLSVFHLHKINELQLYAMFGTHIKLCQEHYEKLAATAGNNEDNSSIDRKSEEKSEKKTEISEKNEIKSSNNSSSNSAKSPTTVHNRPFTSNMLNKTLVLTGLNGEEKHTLLYNSKIVTSLYEVLNFKIYFDSNKSGSQDVLSTRSNYGVSGKGGFIGTATNNSNSNSTSQNSIHLTTTVNVTSGVTNNVTIKNTSSTSNISNNNNNSNNSNNNTIKNSSVNNTNNASNNTKINSTKISSSRNRSSEEELVARVARYGLSVTDSEVAAKALNFESNTISSTGDNILHLIAKRSMLERANAALHSDNLATFQLILDILKTRINAGVITSEAAEALFYSTANRAGETFYTVCNDEAEGAVADDNSKLQVKRLKSYLLQEFLISWGNHTL